MKLKKISTAVLCLPIMALLGSGSLFAAAETKNLMRDVLEDYLKIVPFMYSGKKADSDEVGKALQRLENSFIKAGHDSTLEGANFAPSVSVIKESIDDIRKVHAQGNYEYSKYRLRKVVSVCISCHSQLPKENFRKIHTKYDSVIKENVRTHYDRAMVSYFLRDYDAASASFKKDLESKLKNHRYQLEAEGLLLAILKLALTNQDDGIDARRYLSSIMESEKLSAGIPFGLKAEVVQWIKDLSEKDKVPNGAKLDNKGLKAFINRELVPMEEDLNSFATLTNAVKMFRAKGVLQKFATKNPNSTMMPEVLYWMGLIENQENSLYLYSLGELYLKECITRYPGNSVSGKCYSAYENSLINGFTGTAGTSLPEDVTAELKELKKLIKK